MSNPDGMLSLPVTNPVYSTTTASVPQQALQRTPTSHANPTNSTSVQELIYLAIEDALCSGAPTSSAADTINPG